MRSEKLGIGTVQFGMSYGISNSTGQTPAKEVSRILQTARNKGIELLDSASGYGTAEKVLGQNDLEGFRIVSKYLPPGTGEKVSEQLNQSLEHLKRGSVYAYLAHRPMNLLEHPEQWEELQSFKDEAKVSKIGYSLNDPEELEALLNAGLVPDLIQVPYNFFDRRFERDIQILSEKGCEVHSRSTFLQGLFFMDVDSLDPFFEEVKEEIKEVQAVGGSLAGALLRFVLEKPFIHRVIMGVEHSGQLVDNLHDLKNACSLPDLKNRISESILKPSQWPKK